MLASDPLLQVACVVSKAAPACSEAHVFLKNVSHASLRNVAVQLEPNPAPAPNPTPNPNPNPHPNPHPHPHPNPNQAERTSLEAVVAEWHVQGLLPSALLSTLWDCLQGRRPALREA